MNSAASKKDDGKSEGSDSTGAQPVAGAADEGVWISWSILIAAWSICVAICLLAEGWSTLYPAADDDSLLTQWLNLTAYSSAETLPSLLVLLVGGGIIALMSLARQRAKRVTVPPASTRRDDPKVLPALVFAAISFLCSYSIACKSDPAAGGRKLIFQLQEYPPAYHDEFSYLLQAETFLHGRVAWPAAPTHPELFHQFHVLNDRVTASRYFPWTGLWMAPFVAADSPYWGHWIAGAIAAAFFYLSARMVMSSLAAASAGLLIAVSPGLALFSNLLLAHHPTMMALSLFLWAMLHALRSGKSGWALTAGIALSLAMLGRPMTAAGFALPFGIVVIARLCRVGGRRADGTRLPILPVIAGFAIPLVFSFILLGFYNHRITGSAVRTPYQEYTDRFTPRHRFGFSNTETPESAPSATRPRVIEEYDSWAVELDARRAFRNVLTRWTFSRRWTAGTIPLLLGILLAVATTLFSRTTKTPSPADSETRDERRRNVFLILCSIASLHLVHLPYWYEGIMHWHYVFETAPLLILAAVAGFDRIAKTGAFAGRPIRTTAFHLTIVALFAVALVPMWIGSVNESGLSGIDRELTGIWYAKRKHRELQFLRQSDQFETPAVLLVRNDHRQPHISYIVNRPDYSDDVLAVRDPESDDATSDLRQRFPNRQFYLFDAESSEVTACEQMRQSYFQPAAVSREQSETGSFQKDPVSK